MINITCPKCAKNIQISPEKLPAGKEKAAIKCPGCEQSIVFNIPKKPEAPAPKPPIKTVVDDVPPASTKPFAPKITDKVSKTVYPLALGKNAIGRNADVSIENGDKFISRRHCAIVVSEKSGKISILLTDDGSVSDSGEPSTNGTFYAGKRLTKYDQIYLNSGDTIRIGHTEFVVEF